MLRQFTILYIVLVMINLNTKFKVSSAMRGVLKLKRWPCNPCRLAAHLEVFCHPSDRTCDSQFVFQI